MNDLIVSFAFLATMMSVAHAQAVPDLKGNWAGKGKAVVVGTNAHQTRGEIALILIPTDVFKQGDAERVPAGQNPAAALRGFA